eukprot:3521183-Rhodomonas_salina.2
MTYASRLTQMGLALQENSDGELDEERVEELIQEIGACEEEEEKEMSELMAQFGEEPVEPEELSLMYARVNSLEANADEWKAAMGDQEGYASEEAEEEVDPVAFTLPPKTADGAQLSSTEVQLSSKCVGYASSCSDVAGDCQVAYEEVEKPVEVEQPATQGLSKPVPNWHEVAVFRTERQQCRSIDAFINAVTQGSVSRLLSKG